MKTKLIFLLRFVLTIITTTAAMAEEPYSFELTEAYHFTEKTDNWSIDISVPRISGMADEEEQAKLNEHFLTMKDSIRKGYEQDVEYAEQSPDEGNQPHFSYQYYWNMITDSDDYLVFRTSYFMAAGSSSTENEYWNLDKKTGKLLDFDKDAVTSPEQMAAIRKQIYSEMKASVESGEGMYWIEDDTLDVQLEKVGELNHWYYNSDGDLVITFDKYEIAPGAMGSQEFVIVP